MKENIQKIMFEFESGLFNCGVNADNIDYDRLSEVRMKAWKELGEPEICGEPDFKCTGCISEIDCKILNVTPIDINRGQRKFCACLANKHELLISKSRCNHKCAYCYWRDV